MYSTVNSGRLYPFQIKDFENIDWETVMSGKCGASSFLVRKGLSRKAQLSLQLRRYCSKHPESVLRKAVPITIILETWNAFEEMKLDFGRGTYASFEGEMGVMQAPIRQRLDWCLADAKSVMDEPKHQYAMWILKPSVTNKGADIAVIYSWEDVLTVLEDTDHVREWVLQRYVERPLLLGGHKFHLRVYVLCVGALRVFVFDQILMLLAARRFNAEDLEDIHGHLTNTARAVEDKHFEEEKFVRLLDDLGPYLMKKRKNIYPNLAAANRAIQSIRQSIHSITADVFAAYENEYSIFCPMSNCFELYGLDFLVDSDLQCHFLEVNPGPDFKQTGNRLQGVIAALWEQTCGIALDSGILHPNANTKDTCKSNSSHNKSSTSSSSSSNKNTGDNKLNHAQLDEKYAAEWATSLAPDFTLVYSKEWSAAKHTGGMSFTNDDDHEEKE